MSKKTKDPNLTFTLKKDFGLSHYRLALPPEELDNPEGKLDTAATMPSEKKQKRKSGVFSLLSDKSAQASKGRSAYGGRMSKLMQMDYHEQQKRPRKIPRSAPNTPPLPAKIPHSNGGKYSPMPGRPSPSLHSRLVNKGILSSDGEKRGSLENLRQRYGLEREPENIGQLSEVVREM